MADSTRLRRSILNGLGIVVSILLAFAIDAAWDEALDRRQEAALLEGLRSEFEANLAQLDSILGRFEEWDATLVEFFASPTPPTEDQARLAVEGLYMALMGGDIFDPNMASLQIMVNAGRLDLPSDADLRTLLWTWMRQVEDTEDDIGVFTLMVSEGRRVLTSLGARGVREELRPSWIEQVDRIRASVEASAAAQATLVDRGGYGAELAALRETTRAVLAALD